MPDTFAALVAVLPVLGSIHLTVHLVFEFFRAVMTAEYFNILKYGVLLVSLAHVFQAWT